jgi:signal transduction histidine kinase
MNLPSIRQFLTITVDLILLAAGISNFPSVVDRARGPFDGETRDGRVVIASILDESAAPGLVPGDEIIRIADGAVKRQEALELLGDLHRLHEEVLLEYSRSGQTHTAVIRMVPYYDSPRFAIVMMAVGFAIWCMGLFVASQRLDNMQARILHWSLVLLGSAMLFTQGGVDPPDIFSVANRVMLFFSYMLTAGGFFFFALMYPRQRVRSVPVALTMVFVPALCVAAVTCILYVRLTLDRSPEAVDLFQHSYDLFHVLQAAFAFGMIVAVIQSYRTARTQEDRTRLQWILWGLIAGPMPFLLAIMLPNLLLSRDLIPEDIATAFLLITPFSLAVSFLRHHLFDIEVLINRSIVYTILTVFVGAVYALAVFLVASLVGGRLLYGEYFFVVSASLVLAFVLNPIRRWLQTIVDATVFPVRSGYRQSLARIARALHTALAADDVCRVLVTEVLALVPLRSAAAYVHQEGMLRRVYESSPGFPAVAERLQTAIAIPLRSESGSMLGLLAGVGRTPTEHVTRDEEEFLQSICLTAAESLERLQLQRSIVIEAEERRRVEELNRLKSFFVSSVSHELRTPLTSIRMYAEMLRARRVRTDRQRREYLQIIDREAERLTRMIDSVLDFSRIERGVKEYRPAPCDLRAILRRAGAAMAYPFSIAGGTLRLRIPAKLPSIVADADAIEAAVINLISNALKYSGKIKQVTVTAGRSASRVFIRVEDRGIGIPLDQLDKIFDQFYRVRDGHAAQVGGMGLGLSLVKHIVDAHHGEITVRSTVGKGSAFEISLPAGTAHRRNK